MELGVNESVMEISSAIIDCEESFFSIRKKNQRIDLKEDGYVYVLKSGSISFYRTYDGVLTITMNAPAILGLSQLRRQEITSYYMRCEADCEIWSISNSDAINLLNKNNLWRYAFEILSSHLYLYFQREQMMHRKNARDIVVEHLKFIWDMEECLRNKVSIYGFILSRNYMSRSSVHKIIQDLVHSQMISVSRGRLVSFDESVYSEIYPHHK